MAWVSDTIFSLLVVATGVFGAGTIGFAVAWVRARERAIRAEQRVALAPESGDARVARLEDAMDAIAGEVQQVAEGQRFVSRLLDERGKRAREAGVAVPRVATPRP